MQRFIKFNQKAWLKLYIEVTAELGKKATNDFKKDFFKLMNNPVFGKTMENVRKHRDINLETTEARRNYLVSEKNCHPRVVFSENLLAIEMKRTRILVNKPIYLDISVLEMSKTVMYEFWYD